MFGPGSAAGLINYISRADGEATTGTAQFEWAERSRYRGDVAISGPLDVFQIDDGFTTEMDDKASPRPRRRPT